MDFQIKGHRPFGPVILEAKCPDFIVESLNEYTDEYADKESKNLLSRGIRNPFITSEFAEEIGLIDYMEHLGECYMKICGRTKYGEIFDSDEKEYRYDVVRLPPGDVESKSFGQECIDGWVNIYEESDFTPVHVHGGDLASVMILQLPEDSDGQNEIINDECEGNPNGSLQYYYGVGDTTDFIVDTWTPDQYVGMTLLFPPNLRHSYYPHKLKGQTRKSLSLNYTLLEEN